MRKFMVIEDFSKSSRQAVYQRFHDQGRMLPDGLNFVDSWLEKQGDRCFQIMETDKPELFRTWVECWKDLVDFEITELGEKPKA